MIQIKISKRKEIKMAIIPLIGNTLVTQEELREKIVLGSFEKFEKEIKKKGVKAKPLKFSTGEMEPSDLTAYHKLPKEKKLQQFEQIGIGKPLSVMIRHVYTGRYGGGIFINDMLVTSAWKSIATYNAMPRAVNFAVKNITEKKHLSQTPATDEGTPIVFYTPALTDKNTVVTFEIVLDRIPGEIFDNLSNAFTNAAGIPIFASQATGLLAAGIVTKIVKKILNMIFEGDPILKATESLYYYMAGAPESKEGFYLVIEEETEQKFLEKWTINKSGELVSKEDFKKKYEGDLPYIIISLDGREYREYEKFIPTAASAALLQKFYNINKGQASLDTLIEATSLYSDIRFKKRCDITWSELKKLKKSDKNYEKKKAEYDAYVANILNEDIRKTVEDRT